MDAVLIVVALISLLLAAAMTMVARNHARESRDRAAARAEALRAVALSAPGRPWDLKLRADDPLAESPEMFSAAIAPAAPSRRWLALAAVAGVMTLTLGMVFVLHDPDMRPAPNSTDVRPADRAATSGDSTVPLALLSLRHTANREGGLTVTGLVRNPANGRSLQSVAAVVDLFDQHGQYFASGRATLEQSSLRAGDESPFVVDIPNARGVARYQVAFRRSDGSLVTHVDRRNAIRSDGIAPPVTRVVGAKRSEE